MCLLWNLSSRFLSHLNYLQPLIVSNKVLIPSFASFFNTFVYCPYISLYIVCFTILFTVGEARMNFGNVIHVGRMTFIAILHFPIMGMQLVAL